MAGTSRHRGDQTIRGVLVHKLAYWDSQLWATARLNQIAKVLSEDFQDGRLIETVQFHDPFSPAFDLASVS